MSSLVVFSEPLLLRVNPMNFLLWLFLLTLDSSDKFSAQQLSNTICLMQFCSSPRPSLVDLVLRCRIFVLILYQIIQQDGQVKSAMLDILFGPRDNQLHHPLRTDRPDQPLQRRQRKPVLLGIHWRVGHSDHNIFNHPTDFVHQLGNSEKNAELADVLLLFNFDIRNSDRTGHNHICNPFTRDPIDQFCRHYIIQKLLSSSHRRHCPNMAHQPDPPNCHLHAKVLRFFQLTKQWACWSGRPGCSPDHLNSLESREVLNVDSKCYLFVYTLQSNGFQQQSHPIYIDRERKLSLYDLRGFLENWQGAKLNVAQNISTSNRIQQYQVFSDISAMMIRQNKIVSIIFLVIVIANCGLHFGFVGNVRGYLFNVYDADSTFYETYMNGFVATAGVLILIWSIVQIITYFEINLFGLNKERIGWLMNLLSLIFMFAVAVVIAIYTSNVVYTFNNSNQNLSDMPNAYIKYYRVCIADTVITWILSLPFLSIMLAQKTLDLWDGSSSPTDEKAQPPATQYQMHHT